MELFKLFGTIAINNNEANNAIDTTTQKGEEAEGKLSSAFGKIAKAGALIVTGVAAGGAALYGFANQAAGATDRVDKMSQKIGISRKTFQELDFICSQSGTSVDGLQMGMKSLTAAMDGAASGTKSNVEQFKKLGVSVTNSDGSLRSQEEVFWDTITALQNMDNQTEKARLATELFGRSGTELMPLLNGASGSIDKMRKQAHDLGLVLDDETIDAGVAFTDALDQVKRALASVVTKIGVSVMPIFMKMFDWVKAHMPEIQSVFEKVFGVVETVVGVAVDIIGEIIEKITEFVGWLNSGSTGAEAFKAVVVGLTAAFVAYKTVTLAITAAQKAQVIATNLVAVAQKALNVIMNMNPIGLVIAAITALVAAFLYLWKTNEGFRKFWINLWEKIKDAMRKAKEKISGWIENLKKKFDEFKKKAEEIKNKIVQTWENIKTKTKELKDKVVQWFENIKQGIQDKITAAKNKVTSIFENIRSTIQSKITAAKNKVVEIFNNIKNSISEKIGWARDKVSSAVSKVKSLLSFSGLASSVSTVFNNVKNKIKEKIENARDKVKGAIDKIKGFFNFKWSLPKLKLPHFSVKGKFSLNPPSIPQFSVDWYKRAYDAAAMFTNPTVLPTLGGYKGFGDGNGAEFVTGQRNLYDTVIGAVQAENSGTIAKLETLISMLAEFMPQLIENSNKQIVMNNGALVGQLAPAMDSKLGEINRLRERGR